MSIIALIPAYNPDHLLRDTLDALSAQDVFTQIIVVNDGSYELESQALLNEIQYLPKVKLLLHSVNLGKGAALKTGIDYVNARYAEDLLGVVTLGADGQHQAEDVLAVAQALQQHPKQLTIGVRQFGRDVPLSSRFGNIMTKHCFRFMTGNAVSDTQSGLRAIPRCLFQRLLKLRSRGYEFELDMLMVAHRLEAVLKWVFFLLCIQ